MLRRGDWWRFIDDRYALTASVIKAMIEATRASDASVNIYWTTQRNIPQKTAVFITDLFKSIVLINKVYFSGE
jgi:hypothetical protein